MTSAALPTPMRVTASGASDTTQTFGHDSDLSFVPFGADLSTTELEAIEALPTRSAILIVRSGPTAGARYLLDTDVTTVGRHPEADIFFDDVTVSRRHAEITRDASSFEIVDQRSLNGTYVNGERVDRARLINGVGSADRQVPSQLLRLARRPRAGRGPLMSSAAARERSSSAGLLSIGQVLARLAPEFPTLTSSKLRFLEVQGIVTPTRTESGYRKFSPADLERLRLALTLQRDHYLPLVVIREYLEDIDAGRDPATPASAPPPSIVPAPRRYRREELLSAHERRPAAAQRRDQHGRPRRVRRVHRPARRDPARARRARPARHRAAPRADAPPERRARRHPRRVGSLAAAPPDGCHEPRARERARARARQAPRRAARDLRPRRARSSALLTVQVRSRATRRTL